MHIKMNEKEMQLSIEGLIRILDAIKDTEFVLAVPLEEEIRRIVEGGDADAEETVCKSD